MCAHIPDTLGNDDGLQAFALVEGIIANLQQVGGQFDGCQCLTVGESIVAQLGETLGHLNRHEILATVEGMAADIDDVGRERHLLERLATGKQPVGHFVLPRAHAILALGDAGPREIEVGEGFRLLLAFCPLDDVLNEFDVGTIDRAGHRQLTNLELDAVGDEPREVSGRIVCHRQGLLCCCHEGQQGENGDKKSFSHI